MKWKGGRRSGRIEDRRAGTPYARAQKYVDRVWPKPADPVRRAMYLQAGSGSTYERAVKYADRTRRKK